MLEWTTDGDFSRGFVDGFFDFAELRLVTRGALQPLPSLAELVARFANRRKQRGLFACQFFAFLLASRFALFFGESVKLACLLCVGFGACSRFLEFLALDIQAAQQLFAFECALGQKSLRPSDNWVGHPVAGCDSERTRRTRYSQRHAKRWCHGIEIETDGCVDESWSAGRNFLQAFVVGRHSHCRALVD